jgi:hypothetical protein
MLRERTLGVIMPLNLLMSFPGPEAAPLDPPGVGPAPRRDRV